MLAPASENDLAEVIATATAPLSIRGGDTRGCAIDAAPLTTAALSGITLYEPGALTLVAQAGTPMDDIDAALAAENQMLAFEPMDHRALLGTNGAPTIGGVVATNTSGPRRVQAGACRDFLLGVRFVDGTGTAIKNGGRVMKNVTGYDLARLMCGAYGTLGVLTEVSLKVLPRPETEATITVHGATGLTALAAMSDAMKSPFEVSGAVDTGDAVHIRIEGFDTSVTYRTAELSKTLAAHGEVETVTDKGKSAAFWRSIRDVEPLASHDYVWRSAMAPTATYSGLLAAITQTMRYKAVVDRAGGQCWIGMTAEDMASNAYLFETEDEADTAQAVHASLQNAVADPVVNEGGGGHATLVKGTVDAPRFQPEAAPLAEMATALRAKYDPKGILNPGLMG